MLRLDARGEIVGSLAAYQEGGEKESIAYGRGYVVGGGGGRVLVWDVEAPSTSPRLLGPCQEPVRAVSVGPDGRVVSGGDDTRLSTWTSPRDDAAPRLFGVHNGKVAVLAWDERGRLLSGGPGGIYRWDSGGNANAVVERTNKLLGRYPGGNVTALVALDEGRVAVGGLHDSGLRIFPDANPAYYDLKRKGPASRPWFRRSTGHSRAQCLLVNGMELCAPGASGSTRLPRISSTSFLPGSWPRRGCPMGGWPLAAKMAGSMPGGLAQTDFTRCRGSRLADMTGLYWRWLLCRMAKL